MSKDRNSTEGKTMKNEEGKARARAWMAYVELQDAPSSIFTNWEQGYIAASGDSPEDRAEMLEVYKNRVQKSVKKAA